MALHAGKSVLCEKPFAMSATEAREVAALAHTKQLFVMEAMWTRFLPAIQAMRQWISDGLIGTIRHIEASFGFSVLFNPFGRLFNPALGGGALMDVGVYPISLTHWVLGAPDHVGSNGRAALTGVDESCSAILSYASGATAIVTASLRNKLANDATILGTRGHILVHAPWWRATKVTLARNGSQPETHTFPMVGNGYNYEAAEVQRCLHAGLSESPTMPLAESLNVMHTLDRARDKMHLSAHPNAQWRVAE